MTEQFPDRPEEYDDTMDRLEFSSYFKDFIDKVEKTTGKKLPDGTAEEWAAQGEDLFAKEMMSVRIEGAVLGELAANEPQKALDYMGGEEKARALIGDELVEELLEDIKKRKAEEN